jgi:hypothetical protein
MSTVKNFSPTADFFTVIIALRDNYMRNMGNGNKSIFYKTCIFYTFSTEKAPHLTSPNFSVTRCSTDAHAEMPPHLDPMTLTLRTKHDKSPLSNAPSSTAPSINGLLSVHGDCMSFAGPSRTHRRRSTHGHPCAERTIDRTPASILGRATMAHVMI